MVNTKTTLSKKVLAVVLAVACMVAFTPAIAFTQSANAGTAEQTVSGNITFDGTATAQDIQDLINNSKTDQPNTVTKNDKAYTVTLDAPTAGAAKTITIAKGCSVVINMGSYSYSNAGAISLGGSLTINGTGTFTGATTTGTPAVHAIDGTADATALTIGEGTTFDGDIDLSNATSAATATINGTVTGKVALASTGTITGTGNISDTATVGTTNVKSAATVTVARTDGKTDDPTTGTELTATPSATGTYTYQWTRTKSGTTTAISGATGSTYVVADADAGYSVNVVVKEANKFGSFTATTGISVPTAAKPVITAQPTDQDVASGATPTDMSATFTGAVSYQWYATTSATNTGGTKITGANAATYGVASGYLSTTLKFSKLTSTFTKTYYYCEATNTAGTTASNAAYVALASFGFTKQPVSANVAVGATKNLTVATTPTATSQQWYVATKADLSDARTISSATGLTYSFSQTAKGTYYVYCVAKYGDTSIQSSTATMTVSDLAIVTQPKDIELLSTDTGVNVSFELNADVTAGNVKWYYNDKNSTSGAAEVPTSLGTVTNTGVKSTLSADGSAVYKQLGNKNGSLYVFAKYTAGTTPLTTNIAKVTVVDAAIATQPTDVLTQPGVATPVSFKVNGNNTTRADVTWNYSTNSDMSNATTWATSSSQAPTTLTAPTKAGTYYYQASFTIGTTTYKTNIAKMTVADFAFTTQPASKTVAAGQDVVLKAAVNNTANAKDIKWYSSTTATAPTTKLGLDAAVAAGTAKDTTETGMTFAPDTTTAGTYYYFAVSGPDATPIFSTLSTVTVTPKAKNAKFTVSGSGAKYRVSTATATGGNVHIYGAKSTKYKSITIPSTVKVGNYTYKVTGIDSKAFYKNTKIAKVYVKDTNLVSVGSKAFTKCKKGCKFYLPKAKYNTYKKLLKGKVPAKAKYYHKY